MFVPGLVVVLLGAVVLSGCSAGDGKAGGRDAVAPRLVTNGSGFGGATELKGADRHLTIPLGPLCVSTGSDALIITSVVPRESEGGGEVSDFGIITWKSTDGMDAFFSKPLSKVARLNVLGRTVSANCSGVNRDSQGLVIELHKPTAATAGIAGLDLRYEVSGHEESTYLQFGFRACQDYEDDCVSSIPPAR